MSIWALFLELSVVLYDKKHFGAPDQFQPKL